MPRTTGGTRRNASAKQLQKSTPKTRRLFDGFPPPLLGHESTAPSKETQEDAERKTNKRLPPELRDEIFHICFARSYSLHNVVRVCSQFQALAEPLIWRNVVLDHTSYSLPPYRDALYGYARSAVCQPDLQQIFQHILKMTHLRSLELFLSSMRRDELFQLLGAMPRLIHLSLLVHMWSPAASAECPAVALRLTSLYVDVTSMRDVTLLHMLLRPPRLIATLIPRLATPHLKKFRLICDHMEAGLLTALEVAVGSGSLQEFEVVRCLEAELESTEHLRRFLSGQKGLSVLSSGPREATYGPQGGIHTDGPMFPFPMLNDCLPTLKRFRGKGCDTHIIVGRPLEKVYIEDLDVNFSMQKRVERKRFTRRDEETLKRRLSSASRNITNLKLSSSVLKCLRLGSESLSPSIMDFVFTELIPLEQLSVEVRDTYPEGFFDEWLSVRLGNLKFLTALAFDEVDDIEVLGIPYSGSHRKQMPKCCMISDGQDCSAWVLEKSREWQTFCPALQQIHLFDTDCVRLDAAEWRAYPCWPGVREMSNGRIETVNFWKEF